jgi:diguanylate cyclase (GGDEF)-like protein
MNLSIMRYPRRLEEMAVTDKFTGMLNRHTLTILMDKLLAEYVRQPRPVSMLMLDVDHFKPINDQYGHATGDRLLCRVA